MKIGAPLVPLTVWNDLYSAAATFHSLRPWELLDDLDLIGVTHPFRPSIRKKGLLPEAIDVKRRSNADTLKALSKALGTPIRAKKNLRAIQQLQADLLEHQNVGGGRGR